MARVHVFTPENEFPAGFSRSLYLSGPVLDHNGNDWRAEAIQILESMDLDEDIVVFNPILPNTDRYSVRQDTLQWQLDARKRSDVVFGWLGGEGAVPSAGTRLEIVQEVPFGKALVGVSQPRDGADRQARHKDGFIRQLEMRRVPIVAGLRMSMFKAVQRLTPGQWREGGECTIQLDVFRTPHMRGWVDNLRLAGNRIANGDLLSLSRFSNDPFLVGYRPQIELGNEWVDGPDGTPVPRIKSNEIVILRPAASQVVLVLYNARQPMKSLVLLTAEARPAQNNPIGKFIDVVGGSDGVYPEISPLEIAHKETLDEAGLDIALDRFIQIGRSQQAASLSAWEINGYYVMITQKEFDHVLSNIQDVVGEQETERGKPREEYITRMFATVEAIYGGALPIDNAVKGLVATAMNHIQYGPYVAPTQQSHPSIIGL